MQMKWNSPSGRRVIVSIRFLKIAAVAVIAVILCYAGYRRGLFLPGWIDWQASSDSCGDYALELAYRRVEVSYLDNEIWSSPDAVLVQDAFFEDIDRDGSDELLLLCWKTGRYGTHRPFWIEEDERTWSQHLFVYECADGEVRAKWMSSYMGVEAAAIRPQDGRLAITDRNGEVSIWTWGSWGFAREDFSKEEH